MIPPSALTRRLPERSAWVALACLTVAISLALGVWLGALGSVRGLVGPALVVGIPMGGVAAGVMLGRPWVAVAVVLLSLPVGFVSFPLSFLSFGSVRNLELQVIEAAVIGVTAIVVLGRLAAGRTPLPWAGTLTWGLIIAGAAIVATPSAVELDAAIRQDLFLVAGLLLAMVVLGSCQDLVDVRKVVAVLLAVGSGMCVYGISTVSDLRASFGGGVVANRAEGVFSQPNDLGAFAAILTLVGIGSVLGARTRRGRYAAILATMACLTALMLSLSRGAWIGTMLAGVVLLVLLPRARRALVLAGIPILILVIAYGAFRPEDPQVAVVRARLGTFADPADNPYDDRPSIWQEAFREIRDDPWTGQGPGGFPQASAQAGSFSNTVGADHAHNVLLTVAAETGIPSAVALAGMTVTLGLIALRTVRALRGHPDAALVAGIAAAMAVQIGQGVVDFNLRNPEIFFLMWALAGMLLVARRDAERRELDRRDLDRLAMTRRGLDG